MADERVSLQNIHLFFSAEPKNAEELTQTLEELSVMEPPSPIINRVVEGNPREPSTFKLAYGKEGEGNPITASTNYCNISIEEEGDDLEFHAHCDFWHEFLDQFTQIFRKVAKEFGEVDVEVMSLKALVDESVQDMAIDVDIDAPDPLGDDFVNTGIRIDHYDSPEHDVQNETDILIQQAQNDSRDTTSVRVAGRADGVGVEDAKGFIADRKSDMTNTIDVFLK